MLATQSVIDALADRIERSYRLRRPLWHGSCSTPRVWAVAAKVLHKAHEGDPVLPLDAELFVAAQPGDSDYSDPWLELTDAAAVRHYRNRVRKIIRGLKAELRGEVRFAEERVSAGESIGKVLSAKSRRLSPLGRYIVAHRAGRAAMANRFLDGVREQHRACPLYQQACSQLLAPCLYPDVDRVEEHATPKALTLDVHARAQFHLN